MNQQNRNEPAALVERYLALWNEPDEGVRREGITSLWADDGVQFTRLREIRGYQALEERVRTAYEKFVKTEGFLFRLAGNVEAHHNAIMFTWEMVPVTGGEVASAGTIFFLLSDDGRIRHDYQF